MNMLVRENKDYALNFSLHTTQFIHGEPHKDGSRGIFTHKG